MAPQQLPSRTRPTPSAPPSASRWVLYTYDGIAYLAYEGRLIATATVGTPSQEARVRAMFARLMGVQEAGRA